MSSMIEKVKEWYSTFIGIVLMTTALTGYKFGFPFNISASMALWEGGIGLMLVFLDPRKIALEVWDLIKSKV